MALQRAAANRGTSASPARGAGREIEEGAAAARRRPVLPKEDARLHARYGRGRPRAGVVVGSAAALVAMVLSNHARDPLARSKSRIETVGEDAAGYLRRMPVPGADPEAAACARSMCSMLRTLGAAVGRLAPARRRALLASLASEGPASAAARKAAGRARAHLRQALDLPSAPRRPRPRR